MLPCRPSYGSILVTKKKKNTDEHKRGLIFECVDSQYIHTYVHKRGLIHTTPGGSIHARNMIDLYRLKSLAKAFWIACINTVSSKNIIIADLKIL